MSRYIYIFGDGEINKGDTFDDDDRLSVDAGILDVIDISGDEPKLWDQGEWRDMESAD